MAGLTLVYCCWISPEEIFDSTTSNGIHDCSIILFVIAERVPAAKRYRNAFEVIRQRVIDRISTVEPAERRSRQTVRGLTADLAAFASYPFESTAGSAGDGQFEVDEGSLEQMSHILMDMTTEQFPEFTTHTDESLFPTTYPDSVGSVLYDGTRDYQSSESLHFTDTHGVNLNSYAEEFPTSYGHWSLETGLDPP